jgi:hypothetical protein
MYARILAASLAPILCASSLAAHGEGKACALATPAELETVLGAKATLVPGTMGAADICSAKAGASAVVIRLIKRAGDPPSEKTAHAGVEAVKKMGATVETKTFGPIFCMAITPSAQMAAYGYTTTCTVSKHPMYAVIEVKTEKQGMPMDKVRPIAEKMSSRF